jgi:hypothetical protein
MPNLYASTDALRDRMGIPAGDDREAALAEIIEGASRWVDEQTGHRFYTATETRYYSIKMPIEGQFQDLDASERPWPGRAPTRLAIDDFVSVTQVATDEDGDGIYERVWAATDYWVGPRNAPNMRQPYRYINRNLSTGRYLFPYWEESTSVTGEAGFCTDVNRPTNIRELTLMVAELMARPVADLMVSGAQSYRIGQDLEVTVGVDQLPSAGRAILDYYRGMQIL